MKDLKEIIKLKISIKQWNWKMVKIILMKCLQLIEILLILIGFRKDKKKLWKCKRK
jgi:hypothetical protein